MLHEGEEKYIEALEEIPIDVHVDNWLLLLLFLPCPRDHDEAPKNTSDSKEKSSNGEEGEVTQGRETPLRRHRKYNQHAETEKQRAVLLGLGKNMKSSKTGRKEVPEKDEERDADAETIQNDQDVYAAAWETRHCCMRESRVAVAFAEETHR